MTKIISYSGGSDFSRIAFISARLLLAGTALAGTLKAVPFKHFDVIVADSEATVYVLNPRTGERAIIAQQDKLVRPYDVDRDRDGNIVVSDTGTLSIVQINPFTHHQTVLAEGPALGVPFGLALDRHNRIYVANSRAIMRVDPDTHEVETFAEGGFLKVPLDVAVAPDGSVHVADAQAGVVRIDAATKQQAVVAQGGFLHTPTGIRIDGNHTAYVVDAGGHCLVAVDLHKAGQRLVSAAGFLTTPVGIALCPGGTLLVSDPDAFDLDGGIVTVEQDGTQTPIARGSGDLVNARGIAIVPALLDVPQSPKSIHP